MTSAPSIFATLPLLVGAVLAGLVVGWWLAVAAERVLRPRRPLPAFARWGAAVAMGGSLALVVGRFGLASETPAYLFFALTGVLLAVVDLADKRLPNAIVLPSIGIELVLLVTAAAFSGGWSALLGAALGGAALFAAYLVLALISPRGMGMGDVKFAGFVGVALGYLGWSTWLVGFVAAFLVGGVAALVALLSGRAGLRSSIPFGPSMFAGALLAILLS
ncbi:prepilin peptidase [Luethyella okanaganae]|uniref:Prepilin peptidase n=1 Tax=Luethyella okanaganae TaxID=69372 RepID=A0ABW1VJ74_9MICO